MKYRMKTRASTTGKITGRRRKWKPGDEIEVPKGEFDHISDEHYDTGGKKSRGKKAETAELKPDAETADDPPLPVNATDSAITLAEEHDLDLSTIEGSGQGGRITKGDVESAIVE